MTLILSRRGLLGAFTGLCGFFIRVWSITLLLEQLFVVFLFLGGEWYDTFYFWSNPSSLGVLGHARLACPWCYLDRLMSALRALPCALSWLSTSSGRSSSPGELHGLTKRLVYAFLFGTVWFYHSLSHIYAWGTAWPAQGACRNWQAWSSRRRDFFWSLDRMHRLEVLENSRPYSLWLESIAGPVIDWRQRRRRAKVFVLAMKIYRSILTCFLTCCLVFDQSALSTSKNVVVVVIYLILKIVISMLNILL